MGTIRIKFLFYNKILVPIEFNVEGITAQNNYVYSIARMASNMPGINTGTIYCYRMMNFSGMQDGDEKTIQGHGTKVKITMSGTSDQTATAFESLGWGYRLLCNLGAPINGNKQELPQYFTCCSTLGQVKENIYFRLILGDNSDADTGNLGQYIDITLNASVDND
jgi:hypothetical protein